MVTISYCEGCGHDVIDFENNDQAKKYGALKGAHPKYTFCIDCWHELLCNVIDMAKEKGYLLKVQEKTYVIKEV